MERIRVGVGGIGSETGESSQSGKLPGLKHHQQASMAINFMNAINNNNMQNNRRNSDGINITPDTLFDLPQKSANEVYFLSRAFFLFFCFFFVCLKPNQIKSQMT